MFFGVEVAVVLFLVYVRTAFAMIKRPTVEAL